MQMLPKTYSIFDEHKCELDKLIRRIRLPFIIDALAISVGIGLSFMTSFDDNEYMSSIRFPGMEYLVVYFSVNIWIRIMIILNQVILVVNENIIFGLIVVLVIEMKKLGKKIREVQIKVVEKSSLTGSSESTIEILASKRNKSQNINYFNSQLIEIINKHDEILNIRNEVEDIFSFTFLINFICITVKFCMLEMMTFLSENNAEKLTFITGGFFQLVIFLVQCYLGQKLKDANSDISDAIYEIQWVEIDDYRVKRHLLMMLMRSQRSKSLTCWKFAENSFELFGSVSI